MRTEYLLTPEEKAKLWTPGVWTDEPDVAEWTQEETGVPCLVLRNMELGAFCGYVGVHPTHPWHGVSDPPEAAAPGGITFSGLYADTGITKLDRRGKAVTLPGRPDESYLGFWFLGFDCAHAFDLVPSMRALFPRRRKEPVRIASRGLHPPMVDVYRDFVWVRKQVEELAQAAYEAGPSS